MAKIVIDNIEYTYSYGSTDMVSEDEDIGLSYLTIPGKMSERFKKECGHKKGNRLIIPHYDIDDMLNLSKGSDHECYNADTQIVLMNWLMSKNRKYKLDYLGLDPYWLFHDSFHAKNDVYSYEVHAINSYTEWQRLLEGAEFAFSKGFCIKAETVAKLDAAWTNRWRFSEGSGMQHFSYEVFNRFLTKSDVDHLAWMIACGKYVKSNY